ncbi:MAG: hypothetical protein GY828_03785 [Candidatus Gracilibacteria bacterium]|nr:hypothetical protein [Candidatus Gracilibacteria bacterium]
MLIFKTTGLVLKIHKVGEKEFLYTIFTKDYGKIICQKKLAKHEKTLDIGYIFQCEIETKEEKKIHKMRNIKITSDFSIEKKGFHILQKYMELLAYILHNTPQNVPIFQVVEIVEHLHRYENITTEKLLLGKLKLAHIFGLLGEDHNNQTVKKILGFIHQKQFSEIIRLSGIEESIKKELEKCF